MIFALRLAVAAVFALIGVAGLLLPILPGWLFFLLAILVAFPRSWAAERMLASSEPRLPRATAWLRKRGFGAVAARDTTRAQ